MEWNICKGTSVIREADLEELSKNGYHTQPSWEIGRGTYGQVLMAVVLPEKIVKDSRIQKIISRLGLHGDEVTLYESFKISKKQFVVLEYLRFGDLCKFIARSEFGVLEEETAKTIYKGILQGVKHCHDHGIVHGDLKSDNILLTENLQPKLCDFGFARNMKKQKAATLIHECWGSPGFWAPEILRHKIHNPYHADIWSLGVIMYHMLNGDLPYPCESDHPDGVERILHLQKQHRLVFRCNLTLEACNLIHKILQYNPEKRPKIHDIIKDSWFNVETVSKGGATKTKMFDAFKLDERRRVVLNEKAKHYSRINVNHKLGEIVTLKSRAGNEENNWYKATKGFRGKIVTEAPRIPKPRKWEGSPSETKKSTVTHFPFKLCDDCKERNKHIISDENTKLGINKVKDLELCDECVSNGLGVNFKSMYFTDEDVEVAKIIHEDNVECEKQRAKEALYQKILMPITKPLSPQVKQKKPQGCGRIEKVTEPEDENDASCQTLIETQTGYGDISELKSDIETDESLCKTLFRIQIERDNNIISEIKNYTDTEDSLPERHKHVEFEISDVKTDQNSGETPTQDHKHSEFGDISDIVSEIKTEEALFKPIVPNRKNEDHKDIRKCNNEEMNSSSQQSSKKKRGRRTGNVRKGLKTKKKVGEVDVNEKKTVADHGDNLDHQVKDKKSRGGNHKYSTKFEEPQSKNNKKLKKKNRAKDDQCLTDKEAPNAICNRAEEKTLKSCTTKAPVKRSSIQSYNKNSKVPGKRVSLEEPALGSKVVHWKSSSFMYRKKPSSRCDPSLPDCSPKKPKPNPLPEILGKQNVPNFVPLEAVDSNKDNLDICPKIVKEKLNLKPPPSNTYEQSKLEQQIRELSTQRTPRKRPVTQPIEQKMPVSLNKVPENYSSHEAPANSPLGQKFQVSISRPSVSSCLPRISEASSRSSDRCARSLSSQPATDLSPFSVEIYSGAVWYPPTRCNQTTMTEGSDSISLKNIPVFN